MNFQLLNKKWSSFYNWTILYPSLILLIGVLGLSYFIFSSISHLHFNVENTVNYMLGVFFGAYFGFIILGIVLLFYIVWFIIASDSIAKVLGWNRLVFNALNFLAIFSGLYFITILVFWIKIKDIFEENGFHTSWTGKLKS